MLKGVQKVIKAAVIGATGYAGSELVNLLSVHKDVELTYLASHSYVGKRFSDIYPAYSQCVDLTLQDDDISKASASSDVIFLALPHALASRVVTKEIIKEKVVIDLGADFRLKSSEVYQEWYKAEHGSPALLEDAVYGLPEIHRAEIKKSHLIANPGCYTTCSILALYPLLKHDLINTEGVVIDAKSGVSGAGRSEKTDNLFCEVNENVKAYSVASHRHTPEIEQELSYAAGKEIRLIFTPHLIPMQRGILSTCYATLKEGVTPADVAASYNECYAAEPFVRIISHLPQTRYVRGTNYFDLSFRIDERTNSVIAIGAIDNLIKGAAGQAVQNMNIAFSLDEREGLTMKGGI